MAVIKRAQTLNDKVKVHNAPDMPVLETKKTSVRHEEALDIPGVINDEIDRVSTAVSDIIISRRNHLEQEGVEHARKADEEGYRRGFDEAIEKEREDRLSVIDELLKDAKRRSEHAVHGVGLKIIKLASILAEEIIHKTLEHYPDTIDTIVQETMSHLIGSETVILKVSAEDFRVINAKYDSWLSMAGSAQEFRIEIDRRLNPGDCVIETEGGMIDAKVRTRLETLAEELVKVSP